MKEIKDRLSSLERRCDLLELQVEFLLRDVKKIMAHSEAALKVLKDIQQKEPVLSVGDIVNIEGDEWIVGSVGPVVGLERNGVSMDVREDDLYRYYVSTLA